MLMPVTLTPRRRGTKTKAKEPALLMLQSATYNSGTWVRLTFDRPVNVTAMAVATIVVDDNADTGNRYGGTGTPLLIDPRTVQVSLTQTGDASESGTHLTAGPDTKLAAADDGGTWAGAVNVRLPFP